MPSAGSHVTFAGEAASRDDDAASEVSSPHPPSEVDVQIGTQRLRMHQITRHGSAAFRLNTMGTMPTDLEDEEEREMGTIESCCPWASEFCTRKKERRGLCYWLFVGTFASFLVMFPLFLVWLVTSPMPTEFWNEEYDPFPVLADVQFIKDRRGDAFNMSMSAIPTTWHGCNHSCIGTSPAGTTAEMAFSVHVRLSAEAFDFTAFPVLLASNDFQTWWVASDRNDSHTSPFFPSIDKEAAAAYRLTTDDCSSAPEALPEDLTGPPQQRQGAVEVDAGLSSAPIYAMVCVSWDWDDIAWHAKNTHMSKQDVLERCQAVGGACGSPCSSNPTGGDLIGCSAGVMKVDAASSSLAGVPLPGANFSGEVSLQACVGGPGQQGCTATAAPLSEWPCHQCASNIVVPNAPVDPSNLTRRGARVVQVRYDSLPSMQVTLQNVQLAPTDAVPRAYVLTSKVDLQGRGPAGLLDGSWTKLYLDSNFIVSDPRYNPLAVPVSVLEAAEIEAAKAGTERAEGGEKEAFFGSVAGLPDEIEVETVEQIPMLLDADRHKMDFWEPGKVTLRPDACFASRGPLYLVACAVNQSTYQDDFQFTRGQVVAPPPFNDRCLAVAGRCAHACMEQQAPALQHCDAQSQIIAQEELWEDFKIPTNDAPVVYFFMFSLMIGFAVRLMTYLPGLFSPERHPQHYDAEQTEAFKYIAVCTPSGGETKACVVRNLVGAIAALPRACRCPYHVVYADEGHRHAHKMMFRALVAVCQAVPEEFVATGESSEPRRKAKVSGADFKEENLKDFTKCWTEQSRTFTLKDCETAKMQQRINEMREKDEEGKEIKDLNGKLDIICGLAALRQLQSRHGWPHRNASDAINTLEEAIMRLRAELTVGEKEIVEDRGGSQEASKAVYLDDCEAWSWSSGAAHADPAGPTAVGLADPGKVLYTLHYVARARPDEDERTLKVQHVARGGWYYRIPQDEAIRDERTWLQWRERCQVYQDGDASREAYIVPLRTSRGKAGGLNFCENYLFEYTRASTCLAPVLRHALFAIADARHQFQTDFFHETIPHFFKFGAQHELDARVAFTQSPQYFPEMPDETDYLDTNNANFFRLNCMLRNCCGGVSSCGTNGTWLVRDRRAGAHANDSLWEPEATQRMEFLEKVEVRFFHESCKVEDTASSLDRVVQGKLSRYVNRRLSYGMAKDPVDYLAAVQRWAEGGVVLSLQTFLGCGEGIHMIWMALLLFLSFVGSLIFLIYGPGYQGALASLSVVFTGGDGLVQLYEGLADGCADLFIERGVGEAWSRDVYFNMVLEVETWLTLLLLVVAALAAVTQISHYLHHSPAFAGENRKQFRRTRFPVSMAQWSRLAITLDNLTYFAWFWTAYFWVGFNFYGLWGRRPYHFEAGGMVLFSYFVQALGWSLVLTATSRYQTEQGSAANEVFVLSLTNVWRTTQLFYISAPLVTYSLIMGTSDFLRNRTLGVDISYWVGGDRGAVSKSIAQWWVLLLIIGAILSHIFFWAGLLPHAEVGSLLIVSFIALDVMHPCAFLWLGTTMEMLPAPPSAEMPSWQRGLLRFFQLAFSTALYRNFLRRLVFHPRSAAVVKWIGPTQNLLIPFLTLFIPELGINQALLLLASART